MSKIRFASVAGTFYAGTEEELRAQIENCFLSPLGPGKVPKVVEEGPRNVIALICPHAGYVYSGSVAAHSYYKLALDGKPDVFVILSPNHTGLGTALSLMDSGIWRTPLGDCRIDKEVARAIYETSRIIDVDDAAHLHEHSIEVQLPFLQYLYGGVNFVPICMMLQDVETSASVGEAVARALRGRNAVVVASTDFTHYEPHEGACKKDLLAIDAILALDERKFQEAIRRHSITICGPGPVMAAIVAAKKLGATKAELLAYRTSGDVTGDKSSVVGYGAIALTK